MHLRRLSTIDTHSIFLYAKKTMYGKLSSGMLYIVLIILLLTLGGMTFTGGIIPLDNVIPVSTPAAGDQAAGGQIIVTQTATNPKNNLQLETFGIENCQKTLAVDFLIDTSSSMNENNKLSELKQSLTSFLGSLSDNSVIGVQSFSTQTRNIADLDYYKNNKTTLSNFVTHLSANGSTSTRDAFTLAEQKLSDAITQNKFPGYNYSLIFISDGAPTSGLDKSLNDCLVYKNTPAGPLCFSKREDPRTPPDISQQIKGMGVKIFSIGIFGADDAPIRPYEEQLFQDVSSQPLSTYYYETLSASNLPTIFNTISSKVCQ